MKRICGTIPVNSQSLWVGVDIVSNEESSGLPQFFRDGVEDFFAV